jgi:hypothetical protein
MSISYFGQEHLAPATGTSPEIRAEIDDCVGGRKTLPLSCRAKSTGKIGKSLWCSNRKCCEITKGKSISLGNFETADDKREESRGKSGSEQDDL